MKQTKGAIGNLLNRYKAVLKKCHLLNTFGSLAVASMLVMGGAGVAQAAQLNVIENDAEVSGSFDGYTNTEDRTSAPAVVIGEGLTGITIESGTTFTNNRNDAATFGGAVKALGQFNIEGDVTFSNNVAGENAYGGGALYIRLGDKDGHTITDPVTITSTQFTNNKALNSTTNSGLGGAIALENGKVVLTSVLFDGNSANDGGAIANWYDASDHDGYHSELTSTGTYYIGNSALNHGGAISFKDTAGTLKSSQDVYESNTAAFGGAIFNSSANGEINGSTFTGNNATAARGAGGAIYNAAGGKIDIDNTTFTGNSAALGGAINNAIADRTNDLAAGELSISGSTFENNQALGSQGGAIRNQGTISEISDTDFIGNSAHNGGAINNGTAGVITSISGSTFANNSASTDPLGSAVSYQGGAITNAGTIQAITDSDFTGNTTSGNGGAIANLDDASLGLDGVTVRGNKAGTVASWNGNGGGIYNAGTLTFDGTNTFRDNTAAGVANDIYNTGTITVQSGTTTLHSGLVQVDGTITISGGVLNMASKSSLSFTGNNSKLTINDGTFVADFDQLLKDYNTTSDNGITGDNIVGIKGNLNLRLDAGTTYTAEDYSDAKQALLGQGSEDAVLNFLNGNLELDKSKGEQLVVSGSADNNTVSISNATPTVVAKDQVISNGTRIQSVPTEIVSVVGADKKLLSADTISITESKFTAKGLEIAGTATEGKEDVTLKIDQGSNITLAGGEGDFTGVRAGGANVTTNVEVETGGTFTVGLVGNEKAQNMTLNNVTVSGSFRVDGNGLDTTRITAQKFDVNVDSATAYVDSATLSAKETTISDGGQLDIINSVADLGTLTAKGGMLFFDPSYGNIDGLTNNTLASRLVVGNGSVVNEASGLDNLQELAQSAGFTTRPQGNGKFFLGDGQSMLALGKPIIVKDLNTSGKNTGQIVVDGTVEKVTDDDGIERPYVNGEKVGTVYFGANSLLVINGEELNGNTAAITYGKEGSLNVQNGAKLLIANAVDGTSYTVIKDAKETYFNGVKTAYKDEPFTGWKGDNLLTSSDMITLTYVESGNGTVAFKGKREDAQKIFPSLSGEMAGLVNELYTGRPGAEGEPNWDYADVTSNDMGVRFLSRATDNGYLGKDKQAAAATIESAARMAFAGAVPQMTKMASDSATNSVVNRMGFANPENGAKAMNLDGKLVDDKALGLALWIAPLWSNQNGFGMEAGNLDYGYNANIGGISLGADYTWANNFRAGLMFNIGGGYAESSGDLSETTNSMTFWGVGAYGGWKYENFAVMGDVSYTSTWNSVDQDVDSRMQMGDLEADIQASAISAGLRFEYKLETQYLDLIPHVGARYMSINTWGYDVETNGGTVLEGDGFQQNIWTFPVGITFSKELEMNNDWYFKPSVDFTVIPAAGDIKAKEDVRFTGLPYSTEIETQMMDYFTWQGGLGLEFGNDNMSVGVNYTLQAGQNSTGHGVFGMFRYEF